MASNSITFIPRSVTSVLLVGTTVTNTNSMMISRDYYFIKEEIRLKMKKEISSEY